MHYKEYDILRLGLLYKVGQKTAHGVYDNNFVNSQYFFMIFGTCTLWEICKWMVHSSTT